ncbi:MAG: hypothetical protein HGB00_02785 [Chlorobiaceae bacterium]|nr:hypothetical protein [Chlorobiaceae bacterium]
METIMKKSLLLALLLSISGCAPYLHNGDRQRDRNESYRRDGRGDRDQRRDYDDRRDDDRRDHDNRDRRLNGY